MQRILALIAYIWTSRVLRHSLTLPNDPRPKDVMTMYWLMHVAPEGSCEYCNTLVSLARLVMPAELIRMRLHRQLK